MNTVDKMGSVIMMLIKIEKNARHTPHTHIKEKLTCYRAERRGEAISRAERERQRDQAMNDQRSRVNDSGNEIEVGI